MAKKKAKKEHQPIADDPPDSEGEDAEVEDTAAEDDEFAEAEDDITELEDDAVLGDDDEDAEEFDVEVELTSKEQSARALEIRRKIEQRMEERQFHNDIDYLDYDLDD